MCTRIIQHWPIYFSAAFSIPHRWNTINWLNLSGFEARKEFWQFDGLETHVRIFPDNVGSVWVDTGIGSPGIL